MFLLSLQLSDAQDKISSLEEEIESLSSQLDQARQNEKHLSNTLMGTREALQAYHQTAHQNVEHKDQELTQLQVEISILEQQRKSLEGKVEESRDKVERLEEAHNKAQREVDRLQEVCGRMRVEHESSLDEKEAELNEVKGEKEDIERQLSEKVRELQRDISAAQQDRKRAEQQTSSQDGHVTRLKEALCEYQEEVEKQKALLATKEAELSRIITALQVSSAQVHHVCVCLCTYTCVQMCVSDLVMVVTVKSACWYNAVHVFSLFVHRSQRCIPVSLVTVLAHRLLSHVSYPSANRP